MTIAKTIGYTNDATIAVYADEYGTVYVVAVPDQGAVERCKVLAECDDSVQAADVIASALANPVATAEVCGVDSSFFVNVGGNVVF